MPVANPRDTPDTLPSLQRIRRESTAKTQERSSADLREADRTMIEPPTQGKGADQTMIEGDGASDEEDDGGTLWVPPAKPRE